MGAHALLPLFAPVDGLDARGVHRRARSCVADRANDVFRRNVVGEVRHELVAELLYALRSELEQRSERGVACVTGAHPHGQPAHAPNASFIFAQKPLPRSAGTACWIFASRSINCSSSSVSFSGVQSCTRTCRSPVPEEFTRASPRPRRWNSCPLCVPGGMASATLDVTVGTSSVAPSTSCG